MEKLFLTVLNMSITASSVILVVLLARWALRKAPKAFSYALWAVVLFRLLCPAAIQSIFAIVPDHPDVQSISVPYMQQPFHVETDPATGITTGYAVQSRGYEIYQILASLDWTLIASSLWLAGVAAILGYSIWSMVKLRRNLVGFVQLEGENDVRLVDHIPSPFVMGLFSPKIYLPSDLAESEQDYILLHERTHIRRMDHISRTLAWLALAVHWFNPLVWLAFYLAGKDMEMSCDEVVLRKMGWQVIRTDYSNSLLRLSTGGKLPAGPLAFGGGDLKRRVQNILNYRKPALWVPVLALAAVLTMGAALATDPTGLIAPTSVTSFTRISATHSETPDGALVYTAANRRQDVLNPSDAYEVRKEDGDRLVRLLNSYGKTVYGRGELDFGRGPHEYLIRVGCVDGGFYLIDHWYWNEFSFHPFHGGEDDYTTLVTHYDAEGNAGTTWQMDYYFDAAFQDWCESLNK